MTESLRDEVMAELERLQEAEIRALLQALRRSRLRNWSPAIGSLGDEDAREMMAIIEEGCEKVDPGEW